MKVHFLVGFCLMVFLAECKTHEQEISIDFPGPIENFPGNYEGVKKKYCYLSKYPFCRESRMCHCKEQEAECCNHNRSLTYIPRLSADITSLTFRGNYLPFVNASTFSNISHLNLKTLMIGYNDMKSCGDNAFSVFKNLEHWGIQYSQMNVTNMKICFASIAKTKLRILEIVNFHMHRKELPKDFFSEFNTSSVTKVYLNWTYINIYNHSDFDSFKNLQVLGLIGCSIYKSYLTESKTLKVLVLSSNALIHMPDFCDHNKTMFPNLKELYIDDNFIRHTQSNQIDCLRNLEILSISKNPLSAVTSNTFASSPMLRRIVMNGCTGWKLRTERYAFNSSSLTHLDFRGGLLRYDNIKLSKDTFVSCPKLQQLFLSGNVLKYLSDQFFYHLFAPISNLTHLSLANTGLSFLPNVISEKLPNLEMFFADSNLIPGWSDEYFLNLRFLLVLNLSSNHIATINTTSFSVSNLKTLQAIDLSHNPFSCTCDNLMWFVKLLKSHDAGEKFRNTNNYHCDSPKKWNARRIKDTPLANHYCILHQFTTLISSVCCGLCLLLVVMSTVYRYRWHLRYLLYMIRFYRQRVQNMIQEGRGYQYDVYVSCCEDDVDFLMDNFIPKLEDAMHLRVFLPPRDGIGNKIDGILRNMDDSRRAILCVSEKYARDHYCEFETNVAYDRSLYERRDMMIVVLLEEIESLNMTKTLHKILKVDDYIMWDWNDEGVELFWLKLSRTLNRPDDPRP